MARAAKVMSRLAPTNLTPEYRPLCAIIDHQIADRSQSLEFRNPAGSERKESIFDHRRKKVAFMFFMGKCQVEASHCTSHRRSQELNGFGLLGTFSGLGGCFQGITRAWRMPAWLCNCVCSLRCGGSIETETRVLAK